jgi:hypothetical protein
VKSRFQNLPFKFNLQRYITARTAAAEETQARLASRHDETAAATAGRITLTPGGCQTSYMEHAARHQLNRVWI